MSFQVDQDYSDTATLDLFGDYDGDIYRKFLMLHTWNFIENKVMIIRIDGCYKQSLATTECLPKSIPMLLKEVLHN